MKKLLATLCLLTCLFGTAGAVACGGGAQKPQIPTKADVIRARKTVLDANVEGYDFSFRFGGELSLLGLSGEATANYEGKYRHDKTTGEVQFQRTTSGALLYDSSCYVHTVGEQKIQIKMNDKNEVKKVSIMPNNDEEITLINKPIVAIVNALEIENLGEVQKCAEAGFAYQVAMNFAPENPVLDKLCTVMSKAGTSVSLKGAKFSNPMGGIKLLFNLDEDNRLEDFKITAGLSVPVKLGSKLTLTLTYEQRGATNALSMPTTSGVITDKTQIATQLNAMNASLLNVKDDADYSLDLLAKNEFDPAWNKLATVDKYTARLYKNTDEKAGAVWFNHSYKYKSHTEEDGAENFEYAIGNMTTGDVYLASYKGDNTYTQVFDKTVDTQFDYMIAPVLQSVENVDCLKRVEKGDTTVYYLYLNQSGTASVQDYILDMVNSNTAAGVTKVENYFNVDYFVKEAEIEVEVVDGKVASVKCLTELKYCPTGGEYTDYNITLTNTIELTVNDKLSAAEKYEAPNKPDGWIDNLESIL